MTQDELTTWANKAADALLHGPNELTTAVIERLFRGLESEQIEAIKAHVAAGRKNYTRPVAKAADSESEPEAEPTKKGKE